MAKSGSEKTVVVEHLFDSNWDAATKTLKKQVIDQAEVLAALQYCNARDGLKRGIGNPANFMKDIVRRSTASTIWPTKVTALKYTAVQRTGGSNVFEFVPFAPGQTEPFPDIYKYRPGVATFNVQSLSMLAESRMLGRRDEAWLTQTAVKLGIAETHLALMSPLAGKVVDVIHLQMNMKLRKTEVDAAYMVRVRGRTKNDLVTGIITVEAKQAHERVLENQLVEQVIAALAPPKGRKGVTNPFDFAIPIAMRVEKNRGIYVAEFAQVPASAASAYVQPKLVAEALYELNPRVLGI